LIRHGSKEGMGKAGVGKEVVVGSPPRPQQDQTLEKRMNEQSGYTEKGSSCTAVKEKQKVH
jgi:hypothetical protein